MRPGFWWWDDAVKHAHDLAALSGRRRRVTWDHVRFLWVVRPAIERGLR